MDCFRIHNQPRRSDPTPWFGTTTPNRWTGYCPLLGTIQGIARLRFNGGSSETTKGKMLRIVRSMIEISNLGFVLLPIDNIISAIVGHFRGGPQRAPLGSLLPLPTRRVEPLHIRGDPGQAADWSATCMATPPTGGRRIRNPGNLCYMNAALSALSACPSYLGQVQAAARGNPIAARLEAVLTALNAPGPALLHTGNTEISRLSQALVDSDSRLSFTRHGLAHDANEALEVILNRAGTTFERHHNYGEAVLTDGTHYIQDGRTQTAIISPNLPDGDGSAYSVARPLGLEQLIHDQEPLTIIGSQSPAILPICINRLRAVRNALPILPPLVITVPLAASEETIQESRPVKYYLRSVMVQHPTLGGTGHYATYVPRPGEMDARGFPAQWEFRDGETIRTVTADTALRDILTNSTGFVYEKDPTD